MQGDGKQCKDRENNTMRGKIIQWQENNARRGETIQGEGKQ